jgi:hypothetical protein
MTSNIVKNNNGNFSAGTITGTSLSAGSGTISTTGTINGGAITGTSLSAGSGTISTTGTINGSAITGTSLSAGSGTISTTGTINGGAITGTSLSAGSGTISTTGTINGGAITGTSLSAGSGTISTTGTINGGAITGTSLSAGSGTVTGGLGDFSGDVDSGTGRFEKNGSLVVLNSGGATSIHHIGAAKLTTTSGGVSVTGAMAATGAVSGTTGTFTGAVSGTTGTFSGNVESDGDISTLSGVIRRQATTFMTNIGGAMGSTNIYGTPTVYLYHDGNEVLKSLGATGVQVPGLTSTGAITGTSLSAGTGTVTGGTGDFSGDVDSGTGRFEKNGSLVVLNSGGATSIHHNGAAKLTTTASGIDVTGQIDSSTGELCRDGERIITNNTTKTSIYYNDVEKLTTTNTGIEIPSGDLLLGYPNGKTVSCSKRVSSGTLTFTLTHGAPATTAYRVFVCRYTYCGVGDTTGTAFNTGYIYFGKRQNSPQIAFSTVTPISTAGTAVTIGGNYNASSTTATFTFLASGVRPVVYLEISSQLNVISLV